MDQTYDVIIVGAGPAGTSAAIELAAGRVRVLLIEQKTFPRPKLCGEFISPECFTHFQRLGVAKEMLQHGPSFLKQTTFYSESGRSATIPTRWLGSQPALGLSRAAMDQSLLQRAVQVGVTVIEDSTVTGLIQHEQRVVGVKVRSQGVGKSYFAKLTLDATGRARSLARKVIGPSVMKPNLVAFKVHLVDTEAAAGTCEIYSYPNGYGGLNTIEDGLSNLCFITAASDVRRFRSDPDLVLKNIVLQNRRAASTLKRAVVASEWLSVSLDSFGTRRPIVAPGLIAIGDAAAFIDPFTGSGILMALESGRLAAETFVPHLDKLESSELTEILSRIYEKSYQKKFRSRLRVSGLIRRTAYNPTWAQMMIVACNASDWIGNHLARATRPQHKNSPSSEVSAKYN